MAAAGRIYLASMGIYIFNAGTLRDVLDGKPDDHDFGKQIIPGAIGELKVVAYPFAGYWNDIGTVRSYFETSIMLAQPHPAFNLYDPAMPLYTNARMLPPAKMTRTALEHAIVAEGSIIEDSEITDSVVGIRSYIRRHAHPPRGAAGLDYYGWQEGETRNYAQGPLRPGIGEGTRIENAIVDRNVAIGKRCVITNRQGIREGEGPNWYIRDGIVVIPKNAEIPDGTVI
jgi:glucose-1-phosphate adenylyltransferase